MVTLLCFPLYHTNQLKHMTASQLQMHRNISSKGTLVKLIGVVLPAHLRFNAGLLRSAKSSK